MLNVPIRFILKRRNNNGLTKFDKTLPKIIDFACVFRIIEI